MTSRPFFRLFLAFAVLCSAQGRLTNALGQVPTLVCATNLTVECGASWDFTEPSASAICGGTNVTITILNTVTNPLIGQTFSATRTWTATDACSNSASCSQTVTVVDTIPPTINCPSDITVECAGFSGTQVYFTTSATDACDTNVTIVSTPPSGAFFPLGTNTVVSVATDASGNSNMCSFLVIVSDTTPPLIARPDKVNAAENPRDSGFATVTFPLAAASDICDSSPAVSSYPDSGSTFATGSNTVMCVAVDSSGNSNACNFTVRVIPYRLYVTNLADSGAGTLRQALLDANDSPDENLVLFNLADAAPFRIQLLSPLPEITSPIIIDGWSQGGSNLPPVVELDGSGASNVSDGLVIQAGKSTVRGLILHGFHTAIRLETLGTNIIQGNYLGAAASVLAGGNAGDGLFVASARNLIGGTGAGEGNVISGNDGNGIQFYSPFASNNAVEGNFIGTMPDGTSALPNGLNGVLFTNQPFKNLVGGITNAAANIIAYNGRNGVALSADADVRNGVLGNSIFANGLLAIDLGDDGVTLNDADDSDTGPNNLQNFPDNLDALSANGSLTISGTLTSIQNAAFRLEFFLDGAPDPSGYGQGQVFLGAISVVVHGDSGEPFSATFPISATYTQYVSATASSAGHDTSEFSQTVQVHTPPILGSQPVSTNVVPGQTATFCATASGTPPLFYQWRLNGLNIPGATNACYIIPAADVTNGGTYTVLVGNNSGALSAAPVTLTVPVTNSNPGADNFVDRVTLSGMSGLASTPANRVANRFGTPGRPLSPGRPPSTPSAAPSTRCSRSTPV